MSNEVFISIIRPALPTQDSLNFTLTTLNSHYEVQNLIWLITFSRVATLYIFFFHFYELIFVFCEMVARHENAVERKS